MIIKKLSEDLIIPLAHAFKNWPKPQSLFEAYYQEQQEHIRNVWVALEYKKPVGYVTIKWHSDYIPFSNNNIPEINDLNVLPEYRNQGIGSQLIQSAENAAFEKSDIVGLGVGLYADYGAAQQLYIRKGYIPDGNGITYKSEPVTPGEKVILDDNLLLWLVKRKAKR